MPKLGVGGSEQTVPAHAKAIMLGFPSEFVQVTNTTGQGNKAAKGLFFTFIIDLALQTCI